MARWLRSSAPGPTATRRSAIVSALRDTTHTAGHTTIVPNDGDYRDGREFLQLEGRVDGAGEPLILSRTAFELHGNGIINSLRNGAPGLYPTNV
jgi:hypothetical protein